jgi:RNA polymerase sigma-70 factor (ECF subfamily)
VLTAHRHNTQRTQNSPLSPQWLDHIIRQIMLFIRTIHRLVHPFRASRGVLQSSDERTSFVSSSIPPGAGILRRPVYTCTTHSCKRWNNVDFQTFDGAYVERLRAGDRDTEAHFVAYFGELIVLKLRSRLSSRQALDDVKQETFARCLQLLRSEGGLRNAERLGPLVNSICNHVLSEHFRATSRTEALEDQPAERFVAREPDALARVIAEDNRKIVRQVLEKLPERDRTILRALFLEEREKDDVCREIGVTRDYIRVLLHRAKISFREAYIAQTVDRQTC